MTIIVKNGLCKKLFLDESGKELATLRSTKLFGAEKVVADPKKIVKYKTDIQNLPNKPVGENRHYTFNQGGTLVATALPVYAAGANHFSIPKPPRPIGLEIQMRDKTQWKVKREEKNTIRIWAPNGTGNLSNFSSIRPQIFELPEGSDIFLWAGVYAMIYYMMHEGDIYLV